MATKKKNTGVKKPKIDKAPSLSERITDFSTNGYKDIKFIPKKQTPKK